MRTIAYTCPFVPPEWIAAYGLRPERIVPALSAGGAGAEAMPASAGVCPYARGFVNAVAAAACQADAVVFTTVCDQMRRAAEVFSTLSARPVFLMNVPSTWQTPAAMGLYVDELRRLGRFLVRLGGVAPSDEHLADVMLAYDAGRLPLRVPWAEPGRSPASPRPRVLPSPSASVPLAIVGGPMAAGERDLVGMIERLGGRVVLDATEGGELTLPPPLDPSHVRRDPLAALAEAYFGGIPHPMRRPDSMLYDWLAARLTERGVRGILLHRWPWCDLWHGELGRLREWSPVPVLDLGAGDDGLDLPRQAGRIEAFLEMLREPPR